MKRTILFLGLLLLSFPLLFAQGYKIEVQIKGLKNQQIILGHHKGENLIPDDTVKTDAKGYGVFKGDSLLRKGLYFIYLPNTKYFDFIVGNDQNFFIKTDTTDLIKNLKILNSLENDIFLKYQDMLFSHNKKISELRKQLQQTKDEKKRKQIEQKISKLIDEFEAYYKKTITQYPNLYITEFIKATHEISIPKNITDKKAQYYYYRNHYFDNFNFIDLLYTPFYFTRIDRFLDKVLIQDPDTLNAEIDKMLAKAKPDPEAYKSLLIHLFNKYAKSQLMIAENVYVHLAEIYIRDAYWSDKDFISRLKTKIARKKNCLIGNKAPNLVLNLLPNDSSKIELLRAPLEELREKGLQIEKDTTRTFEQKIPDLSNLIAEFMANMPDQIVLDTIKSKYTILWFMSPSCSHCIHETPLFYKMYLKDLKDKGVTVITIYLEKNTDNWRAFTKDIGKWFDFIEKHHFYKWYNTWNPFANVRFYYDISSTPVLYLLDENKKIIAKRIGYEQAKEIIFDLEKEKNKQK